MRVTVSTMRMTSSTLDCAMVMTMVMVVIMTISTMRVSLSLLGLVVVLGQMIMSIVAVAVVVLFDSGTARPRSRADFGVRSQVGCVSGPS